MTNIVLLRNANQNKAGRKSGSTELLPKRQRQNLGDYELWKTALASVIKQYLGLVWEVSLVEPCEGELGPLRKKKTNKLIQYYLTKLNYPLSGSMSLQNLPRLMEAHCTGSWYMYTTNQDIQLRGALHTSSTTITIFQIHPLFTVGLLLQPKP